MKNLRLGLGAGNRVSLRERSFPVRQRRFFLFYEYARREWGQELAVAYSTAAKEQIRV